VDVLAGQGDGRRPDLGAVLGVLVRLGMCHCYTLVCHQSCA
jgi:hypothetical protein